MKRFLLPALAAVAALAAFAALAQNVSNYTEQGGARTVIGGSLDVVSGGEIDIESGGALKIAGTAVTASAAELNAADITAAGTVQASKAVVVDANKDASAFRNLTVTNLDAGASGTAGSVDVFPATAAKGKLAITAADNTGDTTTALTVAAQAGAVTYTIPDAGASASFVMTAGAQTVAGAKSLTGRATTTDGVASGTARVIGGRAYSAISATDNLLASAGASAHVDFAQTYSIPANTLGANSVVRIRGSVAATNVDGTDTLEVKLYIGGTTLLTVTAFDPSAVTDFVNFEFDLVSRAAAGAAASHAGFGGWVTSDTGAEIRGAAILAPTNLATNGALVVKVSAKWSATTALTNARLEALNVDIN